MSSPIDNESLPLALRACAGVVDTALPADEPTLIDRRPREIRRGASASDQTFVTKVQRETTDDD